MINLDPSIINQDEVRKKRRKKMLLIAIVPEIILIAAGAFFVRQGVFDILFGANYKNEKADVAIALSQMQKVGNIIEPYIAYYNAGTAYLRGGDGVKAEAELRESMKNLPPSDKICQVRVNLSYSIEIQADEAKVLKKYDEALVLYSRAEGILYEDNCANKNEGQNGKDKNADTAKRRISQKRGSVVSEMNGNEGEGGDDPSTGGREITEEQLRKLQQEMNNNGKVREKILEQQGKNRSNGNGGGAYGYYNYHW